MLSDQLPPCPLGWLDLLALTWINISSLLALIYWLIHQDAIATKRKLHLQAKKVLSLSNRFLMAVRQYLCPPTIAPVHLISLLRPISNSRASTIHFVFCPRLPSNLQHWRSRLFEQSMEQRRSSNRRSATESTSPQLSFELPESPH